MEAVYGILGGADRAELRAIGARLEHRGPESAEWSPAEGVWFGVRGSVAVVGRQREGAVVFVGSIDNRRELARGLGRASADGGARARRDLGGESSGRPTARRGSLASRASLPSRCGTREIAVWSSLETGWDMLRSTSRSTASG